MKYTAIAVLALFLGQSSAIQLRGIYSDEYDDLFDPQDTVASFAQK